MASIKRLIQIGKGYWGLIGILLLVQSILSLSGVFVAYVLKMIVDGALAADRSLFFKWALILVTTYLLSLLFRALVRYLNELCRSGIENGLKSELFGRILGKNYEQIRLRHSAGWLNELSSDVGIVAGGITDIVPGVVSTFVRLMGTVGLIISFEPLFGLILIPGGIVLLLMSTVFRRRLKQLHKKILERDGVLKTFLQERLSGLLIVKAYSLEDETVMEAQDLMEEHRKARLERNRFSNVANTGFGFLMYVVLAFTVLFCGYRVLSGALSYGTFMAVFELASQLQSPFASATAYIPRYYAVVASLERIDAIDEYRDDEGLVNREKTSFEAITFEHVSFCYEDDDEHGVLDDFSFEIKRGETVLFMGPSGCGKSTVLRLLMGLFEADSGDIRIDGRVLDCSDRDLFAYVPQGNGLFSGTLREAITFKRTVGDDEIKEALRVACCDFVDELELGLDTRIGERGLGLSEGQIQRLAIARALLTNREVLLLDESTSALDEVTQLRLLKNLRELDKTVIIVSHRAEVESFCDKKYIFSI